MRSGWCVYVSVHATFRVFNILEMLSYFLFFRNHYIPYLSELGYVIVLHDSVVIFKPPRGSGWVPGDGDYE